LLPGKTACYDLAVPFDQNFVRTLEALRILVRKVRSGGNRGDRVSPRKGGSIEFSGHRAYTPGDEIRYIDWNIYARHDNLFVKEFSAEENVHVTLLLDTSASMGFGTPSKFDGAREIAAALAYIGLSHFDSVSLFSFDSVLRGRRKFLRGRNRIFDLLEELERMTPEGRSDFRAAFSSTLPRGKGRSHAVLLTDGYDTEGIIAAIQGLQAQTFEVHLVHLVSREEMSPTLRGRYSLADLETGRRLEATLLPSVLERYRRRFSAFCRDLERTAREREVSHARVCVDDSLEDRVLEIVRSGGVLERR
jgi:uncharacterized protein (DUF58 family)